MSMLTPLGTGGRPRRQRRWPRVVIVLAVLALVAAAGYALMRWLPDDASETPTTAAPSEVCRTPTLKTPDPLPSPAEVTVAVANGTDRAGLAIETADAMAARGFEVGDIGNAERPVSQGVAVVRYSPDDLGAAVVVASFVPGSELKVVANVPTPELWLGPAYPGAEQGVVSPEEADPASVTLPTPDPVCRTPKP